MNRLSSRERRLVVVFGLVLLLTGGFFLVSRSGSGAEIPDLFPESSQPPVVVVAPEASPTFVIPPTARDPFGP